MRRKWCLENVRFFRVGEENARLVNSSSHPNSGGGRFSGSSMSAGSHANRRSGHVGGSHGRRSGGGHPTRGGGRSRGGHRGRAARGYKSHLAHKQPPVLPKRLVVSGPLTAGNFAKLLRREAAEVIKHLLEAGIMATINQEIDVETMAVIADSFQVELVHQPAVDETDLGALETPDDPDRVVSRPPVVTIMGHVDHGKTTLLDCIRHTRVAELESGGITQHIGAYQVEFRDKKITFLDTPGHAAFTTMRARGSKVTDITVLVVAADDGVMPQTVEAINHARAANVPIIVAVNKIDKPEAKPDQIQRQLAEHGLVSEAWGGDTIFVPVSAKKKLGIDELLEMILLLSEMQELKVDPGKAASGVVIDAKLERGRGPVATVLVQSGTLRIGDGVVVGSYFGKIRAMINDCGQRVHSALPSTPVEILGIPDVPGAGDPFLVFADEKRGRILAAKRLLRQREASRSTRSRVTLDDLFERIQEGEIKELAVIIKADVKGSTEAMQEALSKLVVEGVSVRVIHAGVGAITESDILLASASNAIVMGFNVRPESNASAIAGRERVDLRLHRVIYDAVAEIEQAMRGMLGPEFREQVLGTLSVRKIFRIPKLGTIAGSYVLEGKISRGSRVRIVRDGVVVYEGHVGTLRRYKDDVKEAFKGHECGLSVEGYQDVQEGDIIEAFVIEEVPRT
ncbi:translation initiation factor IF-2 [Pasteuria penetrans]|uniref:translation initiation factor IF-2 n=1 Tax=Pasteuria penetrans TaxID=86005 RepID=UPI000FA28A80|nr:translation initiation factor IF-2 [Pasteuria penetrans]